jgi:GT2 family glycosyltransferase
MGKMSATKIYVILVTYNAMQWVDRCLGSLRLSSIPLTPVVIDNGSQDETVAYIRAHFPEAILLEQKQNLGFGQGNNVGIRYALQHDATHVLLLNQDAWIEADMVEKLLAYDDHNSLLSPIHLTGEGDAVDKNFRQNAIRRSVEYQRYLADQAAGTSSKYATREINAACWFIPREVLEEIGGFNPLFFHYAEDNDYLQRLHYHGKGVYFISGTHCFHDRAHVPAKKPTEQSIYQQLILRAVDINYTPFVCALHRLRYGMAVWHTALAEHRLHDIVLYYRARHRFCRQTKAVRENRHIIQTKGAHWIE